MPYPVDDTTCHDMAEYFLTHNELSETYTEIDMLNFIKFALKRLNEINQSRLSNHQKIKEKIVFLDVLSACAAWLLSRERTLSNLTDLHPGIPWTHLSKISQLTHPQYQPTQGIAGKIFLPTTFLTPHEIASFIQEISQKETMDALEHAINQIEAHPKIRQTKGIANTLRLAVDRKSRADLVTLSQNAIELLKEFISPDLEHSIFFDFNQKMIFLLRMLQHLGEIAVNFSSLDQTHQVFETLKNLRNVVAHPERRENHEKIEQCLATGFISLKEEKYNIEEILIDAISAFESFINTDFNSKTETDYQQTLEKTPEKSTVVPIDNAPIPKKEALSDYEKSYQDLDHVIKAYENDLSFLMKCHAQNQKTYQIALSLFGSPLEFLQKKIRFEHCLREYYQIRLGSYVRALLCNRLIKDKLPKDALEALKIARGFLAHGALNHIGSGRSEIRDSAIINGKIIALSQAILPSLLEQKAHIDFIHALRNNTFYHPAKTYSPLDRVAKIKMCAAAVISEAVSTEDARLALECFLKMMIDFNSLDNAFSQCHALDFWDALYALNENIGALNTASFETFRQALTNDKELERLLAAYESIPYPFPSERLDLKLFQAKLALDMCLWNEKKSAIDVAIKALIRNPFQGKQILENILKKAEARIAKSEEIQNLMLFKSLLTKVRYGLEHYHSDKITKDYFLELLQIWEALSDSVRKDLKEMAPYFEKTADFIHNRLVEDKTKQAKTCLSLLSHDEISKQYATLNHKIQQMINLVQPVLEKKSLSTAEKGTVASLWDETKKIELSEEDVDLISTREYSKFQIGR